MGWRIRIRGDEGCDSPTPFLSPDIVLQTNIGASLGFDHALADPEETQNRGGLRSREGLHTAITIQLFTDRRIRPDQDVLDDRDPDPRGWWGDSVNIKNERSETELGSHLWTLRRSILTNEVVELAAEYCREALQPIVDQGAVARFDVVAEAQSMSQGGHASTGVLAIEIKGYSQTGARVYDQKFDALWDAIRDLAV